MRVLGWLLLIPGALAALGILLLDLFPVTHTWHPFLIAAATFIPLLWLPTVVALMGLVILVEGLPRLLAVAGLVVALLFFGWGLLPKWPVVMDVAPAHRGLTVLMLNTQYGRADLDQVHAAVEEHSPDLLIFLEHTAAFDEGLTAAGIAEEYPHKVGTIREDAGGTMILGRQAITEVERLPDTRFDNIVVSTTVADVEWVVAGIHTSPPQVGADAWTSDGEAVRDLALRHRGEQFIMVGDFNAIDQHYTMRLIADAGMENPSSGRPPLDGWRPTWPVGSWVPTFARIDHYLLGPEVLGWAPQTVQIDGTDHLGLVAHTGIPT
ncbi:MAG: hypothetical protein Q4G35_01175 [Propionibacteriaceae bacterium]|nr:hypothetical protein [Propionibacteriaceae bacterium]